jgi:hypothetical protein
MRNSRIALTIAVFKRLYPFTHGHFSQVTQNQIIFLNSK